MFTALIVEDEPLMREYLMQNLTSIHGQWKTAACARDGLEALALLQKDKYDLVITDIKMPRMDGIELAAYIFTNKIDTDVVFLTGYDEFDYARAAVRMAVSDYLLKPLQEAELHGLLEKVAEKRRGIGDTGFHDHRNSLSPIESDPKQEDASVLVQRARLFIKEHFAQPLSLNEVANELDVSPAYLSSVFKSEKGESYSKYVLRLRMERAALLLQTHAAGKVSDIAKDVGYLSVKHFDAVFKKYYGVTPNIYREQCKLT